MAITTTTALPPAIQQSMAYKLLSVPTPKLIHGLCAMQKQMPANGGSTLRMRRYNALNTATVPLGNSGVTPPAQTLGSVDIDADIDFYGTYVYLNEQVTLQNIEDVLNEAALRLGVSLRQTEDELMRNMLQATASFVNCVNGTNGDNPTEITRADIDGVIQTLENNDAMNIEDVIEGQNRFGTAPVRDSYIAMGRTHLIHDIEAVNGFIAKAQYPNQNTVLRAEWGSVSNLRFLLSSIGAYEATASMNAADVNDVFIAGMEAYCAIEQDAYSTKFIYRPAIYDGPLALNASAGYKFAGAFRITNDAWIINLRCTLNV